jgi:hypothetical protein
MSVGKDGARCAKCGTPEDRAGSEFCRKCGNRLRGTGPTVLEQGRPPAAASAPTKPAKTVPDEPAPLAMVARAARAHPAPAHVQPAPAPPARAQSAQAAHTTSSGVARLLSIRIGPPWYLAGLYFVLRVVAGFVLSATAAATLGWVRETHGSDIARALATTPKSGLLDLVFGAAFAISSLVIGYLVFAFTARRWRRPKWGRA